MVARLAATSSRHRRRAAPPGRVDRQQAAGHDRYLRRPRPPLPRHRQHRHRPAPSDGDDSHLCSPPTRRCTRQGEGQEQRPAPTPPSWPSSRRASSSSSPAAARADAGRAAAHFQPKIDTPPVAWSASKPCCAGSIRRAGWCRRWSSFRWEERGLIVRSAAGSRPRRQTGLARRRPARAAGRVNLSARQFASDTCRRLHRDEGAKSPRAIRGRTNGERPDADPDRANQSSSCTASACGSRSTTSARLLVART